MRIDGIIFDLDGTVIDSMRYWDNVSPNYLIRKKITPVPNIKEIVMKMTLPQTAHYFKETYHMSETEEEITKELTQCVINLYANEIPLKPSILPFLKEMKKRNIPMAIATASERALIMPALVRLQITDYFIGIYTCVEVGSGKDESPLVYEEALNALGTDKRHTYVFEDALHAASMAKKGGFPVVAIFDETSERDWEEICNVTDYNIQNYDQFLEFCKA